MVTSMLEDRLNAKFVIGNANNAMLTQVIANPISAEEIDYIHHSVNAHKEHSKMELVKIVLTAIGNAANAHHQINVMFVLETEFYQAAIVHQEHSNKTNVNTAQHVLGNVKNVTPKITTA